MKEFFNNFSSQASNSFSSLKSSIQNSLLSRLNRKSKSISKPRKIIVRKSSKNAYLSDDDQPLEPLEQLEPPKVQVEPSEITTPKRDTEVQHLLEASLKRIRVLEVKVEALQSSPVSVSKRSKSSKITKTSVSTTQKGRRVDNDFLMKSLLSELKSKMNKSK